jgi:hypothetical protein
MAVLGVDVTMRLTSPDTALPRPASLSASIFMGVNNSLISHDSVGERVVWEPTASSLFISAPHGEPPPFSGVIRARKVIL